MPETHAKTEYVQLNVPDKRMGFHEIWRFLMQPSLEDTEIFKNCIS